MESAYYAAVQEDCTSGLIVEMFDDSDVVGADVVLLLGCLQSCMPKPVEGLLEVHEDLVEVVMLERERGRALKIFITEDSSKCEED